jgi:xylulokinase
MFLPFLTGERAGFGASVPAAFVGLQPQHGRAHLVRAVLDGVAFELHRMFDRWSIEGDGPAEVRVVGGGAKDGLQLQILADTFGWPVVRLERDSSYGAAVLAGMGVGWWEAAPSTSGSVPVDPGARHTQVSAASYERYRRLYETLGTL